MEFKYLLLILTIVIIVVMLVQTHCNRNHNQTREKYTDVNISNEALANIASVYNGETLTANNITSSGNVNANNLTATNLTATNLTATNSTTSGNTNANIINANNVNTKNFIGADIKLSKGWTGYTDSGTDKSEISNDTGSYKTLMVVGNKSNDPNGPRRVGIWDELDVNGKTKFRVMDNVQAADGWDIGSSTTVADFNTCANTCYGKNVLCATFRKHDKQCWCKKIIGIQNENNNDWTTAFFV